MKKTVIAFLGLAALGTMSRAHAENTPVEKRTSFTIAEPVEVPGAILKPGSYVIRLKSSATEHNVLQLFSVLQILSPDTSKVFATVVSMPDYNLPPPDNAVFSYFERGAGHPRTMKAWWYPAPNQYGEQFFYPRPQALVIANNAKGGVLSLPAEMSAVMMQAAAEPQPPAPQSLPGTAPPFTAKVAPPSTADVQMASVKKMARLPKTAGDFPMVAAAGLLCILAALILGTGSSWIRSGSKVRLRMVYRFNRPDA
jgi:hypothetical protein